MGSHLGPWLILILSLYGVLGVGTVGRPADGESNTAVVTLFSQGYSIYNTQDRVKAQQDAIRNLQEQAVLQALSSLANPSLLGSHYTVLQEKLLSGSERYVQAYRVFSENPTDDGLYRVAGQVTVNLEVLREDWVELGLADEPTAAAEEEPSSAEAPGEPEAPPPAEMTALLEGALEESLQEASEAHGPGREVFWVVAENWDQQWHLPQDSRDLQGLFALSVLQESRDYPWTLRLPNPGSLTVDEKGMVSSTQAIALAKGLNVDRVILGSISLRPKQQKRDARLEVFLRVIDTASGKSLAEIRREKSVDAGSVQEDIIALASLVVPELDRRLGEAGRPAAAAQPAGASPAAPSASSSLGLWTLRLRSGGYYGPWAELEKLLRKQFPAMQLKGLELGSAEDVVRLDGIDGDFLKSLHGAQLQEGVHIRVDAFSPKEHSITVTFVGSKSFKPGLRP